MKTQVADINETRKTITVSIEAAEIDKEQKKLLSQFAQQVRIPGFRPGKAPAAIILKKYGKDVEEELKRKVVSSAYEQISKDDEVKIFNVVDLKEDDIQAGKDSEIVFTVDIEPTIELPEYTGISVNVPEVEVTDKDVEEAIYTLRSQRADFVVKEEGAEATDYVQISYEGTLDGKPLAESVECKALFSKQEKTWEEAGTDRADFPGLAAELIGMKTGESKDITVDFPADFSEESLQGKSVAYSVSVTEVRAKKLPEMDEEFFKSVNTENEDTLKEMMKTDINRRKDQEVNQIKREQILAHLGEKTSFALPQSSIDNETARLVQQAMSSQANQPSEEQKSEEALKLEVGTEAERRVKINLIIHKIAEEEKITAEDQDFQNMIFQEAMYTRQKPEDIAKSLRKDQAKVRSMADSIVINKTLDFLADKATVSETKD